MNALNAGTIAAILTLDAGQFTSGLASSRAAASVFGRSTATASDKLKSLGSVAASVGRVLTTTITVAALAATVAMSAAAADLQDSANKVSTIADTQIITTEEIKDGLQDMAVETGKSTGMLAEGMYNVISATGDTANALGYLEIATKTAVGGFADVNTSVNGLTTVLNSYGQSGTTAMQSIADMMLTAQNFGKTTVGEIASSIGNVAATASSTNVSIAELMASVATLTKNGLGTSEAVTGMKAALSNVLKPTADAAKAAKELGIDFSAASLQSLGFSGFLDMVAAKAGGNTQVMSELFGSVEALNAMLILTGKTGGQDFDNAMSAMGRSAGAVETAYGTMASGINTQTAQLRQNFVGLIQDYGGIIQPTVSQGIELASGVIDHIRSLDEGTQKLIVNMIALAAGIGPVLLVGGKLLTLFSGPVGWVALTIAATAAIVAYVAATRDATDAQTEFLNSVNDADEVAELTAKFKGEVEIDTSSVSGDTQSALDQMKRIISTTLSPDQVDEIVGLIEGSLDPVEKAFTTFGVPDEDANALETAIREARSTLYLKLQKIGLSQEQINYVCDKLIGADYESRSTTAMCAISPSASRTTTSSSRSFSRASTHSGTPNLSP